MKFDHPVFFEDPISSPQPLSTVSFTGHRKIAMPRLTNSANKYQALQQIIERAVRGLYEQGYRTFMTGMAEGFDLIAAKAVLNLRQEMKSLKLVCVMPFQGQQTYFSPNWKKMYAEVLASADETVYIAERYADKIFFRRNDYLVARCSCMICYFDGRQRSGTAYTVRRAEKAHHRIINLYDSF